MITRQKDAGLIDVLQEEARPLTHDNDAILDAIGEAQVVLIGEATHGTKNFYEIRAQLTQRLITEKGFDAVAVEADWPDAYRVNRYVRRRNDDKSATEALSDFKRFPTWMWRNTVVRDFVAWLRDHNGSARASDQAGFYGVDLYSLNQSMEAVVDYLESVDPEAAQRARQRYGCFDHYGNEPQAYGYAVSIGIDKDCESEVIRQLADLRRHAMDYLRRDGMVAEDEQFCAEQNARLARNAEHYYRQMYQGDVSSWNLRDRHMGDTLQALRTHLRRHGRKGRVVVWAHNSHLGDARATAMGDRGDLNLGQLAREAYSEDAFLIGFTTYTGSVTAASNWGAPTENKRVLPGREDSFEGLFHKVDAPSFFLDFSQGGRAAQALDKPRLERAIGVIYRPDTEFYSHYFEADLPQQFDLVLHVDQTQALEPLDRTPHWNAEVSDTFPTGL